MRFFPGWDLLAQAASGVLSLNGYPGTDKFYKLPDYTGDFVPGNMGALAILMALYYRNKTGKGQYIDISQSEVLMRLMCNFTYHKLFGGEIGRNANTDPAMIPASIMKTSDGKFIALACATNEQFKGLLNSMGKSELFNDARFSKALEREKPENANALTEIVVNWVSSKTCDEIIEQAKMSAFPAAEVADDYMISNDKWRRERGSVILFNDDMYGNLVVPTSSAILSGTPAKIKWLSRPLGYHNRVVLKKFLGLSEKDIDELEKRKVIGSYDDRPGLKPPIYYNLAKDPIYNYGKKEVNK
jgi:crotonobetainyl-CoA:carnitine CoA-transferase CaiB-like acyl-CoA transferase